MKRKDTTILDNAERSAYREYHGGAQMNLDDRLEALTQSVELLAGMHRENEFASPPMNAASRQMRNVWSG
jgi:hypothetical protein